MTQSSVSSARVNLSIDVPDLQAGLDFYCSCFGMRELSRPFPTMAIVQAENLTICVHEKAGGTTPSVDCDEKRHYTRHWTPVHIDFHVDEFEATMALLERYGATVEQTFDHPKRVAFCSDPFGNGFCVIG